MAVIVAVLLLALILGGLGFAVHLLWWVALAVFIVWLLGFAFRSSSRSAAQSRGARRW